jgi:transcriptional regulator with XRE-family HTH domain
MCELAIEIRIARIRAGLTQAQLAASLYCDRATVSRWETGKVPISEEWLDKVEKATGVKIENDTF